MSSTHPGGRPPDDADLAALLRAEGHVAPHALARCLNEAAQSNMPLSDVLRAQQMATPEALAATLARLYRVPLCDPLRDPPDPRLIDRLGVAECLALQVLPLQRVGGVTLVAMAEPGLFARHQTRIETELGPARPVAAAAPAIVAALERARRSALRHLAETRVDPHESCRSWPVTTLRAALAPLILTLALALWLVPQTMFHVLTLWAVVTLTATVALRGTALVLSLRRDDDDAMPGATPVVARLPVVSVMVPLFRETDIAPRLVRRLGRLDYPRALLDIVLVTEECDADTRDALMRAGLPGWMRIVTVPEGPLRTKPRALNYALDHCRGSIVGIYDAEDAPEPDQIRRVVARFAARPPEVACLQGILDYYNPRSNWIARCFTVEYAAWFRVVMPGLQRLGLPLPLGGTSLFLRRAALEKAGAWDAWNVTEDADLGIRLARHGLRTEMINTTTYEEANCRARPWIKQRSRWIKGHILTWAVHMRDPRRLWRDLGPRGFLGYQAVFFGAQSQVLLAPFMWSFWLIPLGLPHPGTALLSPAVLSSVIGLFLLAEALTIGLGMLGARRTRHTRLWAWAPTLHGYYPMGSIAGWIALAEVFTKPFYWAKTSHGHFDAPGAPLPAPPAVACATAPHPGPEPRPGAAPVSPACAPRPRPSALRPHRS